MITVVTTISSDYLFSFYTCYFLTYTKIGQKRFKISKKCKKKGSILIVSNLYFLNGGADGIRTHAPVTRSTSLAGKPLEPLEYYSNYQALLHYIVKHSACQMIFAVNLWQSPFLQFLLKPLDYSSNIPLYSLYLAQSLFRYRRTMLQTY